MKHDALEHNPLGACTHDVPDVDRGRAVGADPGMRRGMRAVSIVTSTAGKHDVRPSRRLFHLSAAAVALAVAASLGINLDAWSQSARTIKIIVPLAPGGGSDIIARIFADQIGRGYGPTVVIESWPGAGSVIGTEAASRAAPDGNTLLINTANIVIAPHLRKLSYNPLTSFEPVCELVNTPLVVVVNPASPYRRLADLLDAAKAKPGELTMASVGPATTLHIASEKLRRAAGVTMTYVPFSGTGPAVTALLGQHVTSLVAELPAVAEQLRAGTLRPLAIGSRTRLIASRGADHCGIRLSGYRHRHLVGAVRARQDPEERPRPTDRLDFRRR